MIDKFISNENLFFGEYNLIDYLDTLKEAIIVLIEIEEFKYLSFSLKNEISKKLQKQFAEKLLLYMPKKCNFERVYLLEGGKIVFVKSYNRELIIEEDLKKTIKEFQEKVNKAKIKIGLVDYTLYIITSLAYGVNAFENAKVGLHNLFYSKKNFIIANELVEKEKAFAVKKLQTFKMLRKAINTYNIISYFQPIVNNRTQRVEKYESLVRLIDDENRIVSPYSFLETAKEGKYYNEIIAIVLRNSFRALFYTDMEISINLSTLDMTVESTRKEFFELLERYKTETHRITVEILEDEKIYDLETTQEFISYIKSKGVNIAIDDFGKGFSNFSRVLAYEPDYIKIDGSLIRDIEYNIASKNMVETIVYFSKKQGIKTIAEYVENENIYKIICDIGVDYSQGYYFGKADMLKGEVI